MTRPLVLFLLVIVVVAGALFLLAGQADEVPTQTVEVDVTNAAGQ